MSDIKVNKGQWDSISTDEQNRITDALVDSGALKKGDKIIGSDSVPVFDENTPMELSWNPLKDLCKAACDVAAATALAWCTANTGGVALAACIAATEATRRECKNRC
ncbi:hypothetical protein [Agarivorans sp. JK6]|uniref:hypothetical protein n=1 Tax=Agarivorans sp. JK6 TaxID=2997426 RepID=UPI0038736109